MEKPKTFFINKYGIAIVKCCASCRHKKNLKCYRFFDAQQLQSTPCKEWALNPNLDNAGKGNGKVKKIDYLRFALSCMEEKKCSWDLERIRNEYRRSSGNIYVIEK